MSNDFCISTNIQQLRFQAYFNLALIVFLVAPLLVFTVYEFWNYWKDKQKEFLTTTFYVLAVQALVANLVQLLDQMVQYFQGSLNFASLVCLELLSRHSIIYIGFF